VKSELGHCEEAQQLLDDLATHEFGDIPKDNNWLPGMALLGAACHTLDDRPRARLLHEL
jgi:hypothetical protein